MIVAMVRERNPLYEDFQDSPVGKAASHPSLYLSLILISFDRRNVNCPVSSGHRTQCSESSHALFAYDIAAQNPCQILQCFTYVCACMCAHAQSFSLPHASFMSQRWHHKDPKICMICERQGQWQLLGTGLPTAPPSCSQCPPGQLYYFPLQQQCQIFLI